MKKKLIILNQELQKFLQKFAKNKKINANQIINEIQQIEANFTNPKALQFQTAILNLPDIKIDEIEFENTIKITSQIINNLEKEKIFQQLIGLKPWRKGPFNLFDIEIDAEWQSQIKWQRLEKFLPDLENKTILDIGANSGYYLFRMLSYKPKLVMAIDPMTLFFYQFKAINKYVKAENIYYLPLRTENFAPYCQSLFHIIFAMGIIYHQKSPLEFLAQIRKMLRKNGNLILESITIPGEDNYILFPKNRYAKMRNTYFIPTAKALISMVERAGFKNVELINTVKTTVDEQRKTWWMQYESLTDFLDPNDKTKTIEGYPAPERSIIIAQKI